MNREIVLTRCLRGHFAEASGSLGRAEKCIDPFGSDVPVGSDLTCPSNQSPMERGPNDSNTQYIPFDDQMVAVRYDPAENRISLLGSTPIASRGRTGTTPTIVEAGGRRLVVAVGARCAVEDVWTGAIRCDRQDRSASRLVALPLPVGPPRAADIRSARFNRHNREFAGRARRPDRRRNYSGYTPDGPEDGESDRATGLAIMQ